MSENLKSFFKLASQDEALKAKAVELKDMEKEEVIKTCIALAAERGITLTEADFEPTASADAGELSDDELDAVSGGGCGDGSMDSCICAVGGGGGGSGKNKVGATWGCACAAYGQGGDGKSEHFVCICTVYGTGKDWGED